MLHGALVQQKSLDMQLSWAGNTWASVRVTMISP